jgi:myosin heavy subunit
MEDYSNLLYIDEISLERCIKVLEDRFYNKKIYTKLGSILLSINPYEYFEDDFKDQVHLNKEVDNILKNLENKNQIIIVSGESGSGKTETTKQIIHYLNSCVKNSDNKLIERIEASGIILEYFGNATTSKNTNSSRFGKLIEVYYNKNMECLGMKIITYILEKTRVLRSEEIGKFHIFNRDVNEIIDLLNKGGFTEENISFIMDNIEIIKYLLNIGYGDNIKNNKLRDVLSKRTIKVQDEMIEKTYDKEEFNEIRDILVMKIYNNLFSWIVDRMNIICNVETYDYKIGILDIFGFEDLEENSLEQLLINYTNEIIQGLLNKILIENKIELYRNEEINIEVKNIELNKEQIKLIEQIFIKLDEECMVPKGSDNNLLHKLNNSNGNNKQYKIIKNNNNIVFGIEHYAGLIEYKIINFLKKNMDKNIQEIEEYINELFNYRLKKKMTSKLKINSITNQFKIQINEFIESINSCDINFIKCIKSNSNDKPLYFDKSLVKEQLIYNGVLQLINILKQGYRYNFIKDDFIKKYKYIIYKNNNDINVVYGKTRVFLEEETYNIIQKRYNEYMIKNAIIIQKNIRMKQNYNNYKKLRLNIILLQNVIRVFIAKRKYKLERSIKKIQNFIYNVITQKRKEKRNNILYLINKVRCINCYNDYYNIKKSVSIIKSNYIIYKIRENIIEKKKSIILIQRWWRCYLKMKNNFLIMYNKLENELIIQQRINIEKEQKIISLETLNNELIQKNKILEELLKNKKIKNNKKANNDYDIVEANEILEENEISDDDEFSDVEYENIDINEKTDENGIRNNNNDNVNKFKLIINNLYKDIEHYKQDINSRITEKLNLVNQLELVNRENRDLLRHVDHLKNKNWFSMLFNH